MIICKAWHAAKSIYLIIIIFTTYDFNVTSSVCLQPCLSIHWGSSFHDHSRHFFASLINISVVILTCVCCTQMLAVQQKQSTRNLSRLRVPFYRQLIISFEKIPNMMKSDYKSESKTVCMPYTSLLFLRCWCKIEPENNTGRISLCVGLVFSIPPHYAQRMMQSAVRQTT